MHRAVIHQKVYFAAVRVPLTSGGSGQGQVGDSFGPLQISGKVRKIVTRRVMVVLAKTKTNNPTAAATMDANLLDLFWEGFGLESYVIPCPLTPLVFV